MKKKHLIILSAIVLPIICVSIAIIVSKNTNNSNNNNVINNNYSDSKSIELEYQGYLEDMDYDNTNYVFKSYEEYNKYFDEDKVTKNDFNDSNYVLIPIKFNECHEYDFNVNRYDIQGDTINVFVTYNTSCGVCAQSFIYFLIPIDKNITINNINVEYEVLKKSNCNYDVSYKPIIYLYPTTNMNINVKLGNASLLTASYPKYNKEWNIYVKTNGDIIYNNRTYYGLYWEAYNDIKEEFKDGFVVSKEDTASFLEEKLSILGLNEREANEFIIYWLPILEENNYNLIRFAENDIINEQMPLEINPKPDTIIRALMEYKPISGIIDIQEQKLAPATRNGYSVIEWGGTLIK